MTQYLDTEDLVAGDVVILPPDRRAIVQYVDTAGVWDAYGRLWERAELTPTVAWLGNIFDGPISPSL